MQHSQTSRVHPTGLPVSLALWLGLGGLAAWIVTSPVSASGLGLSAMIGLLTLFVAAITATFSLRYMRSDLRSRRFFAMLGGLAGSVLVVLFAGNLAVLAAAWCLSGWLLAGLIGHAEGWAEAGAAARRTRLSFLVGDAALVAALVVLGWQAGSWQLGDVLAAAGTLPPLPAVSAALLLVVAAAARCALPPFSGWLLSSMTAPTPVSALMHAGLVNAGGFLLIRFAPVVEAAPAARLVAVAAGLFAAIYGIGVMMVRPDVKRSLAGSTVSQMGFMIMSCGLGAYAAALWHIVAHGLFKAWLFLGSGSNVGMKGAGAKGRGAAAVSPLASFPIALATAGIAAWLIGTGTGDASLVPLLLGLATAAALLAGSLGASGLKALGSGLAAIAALAAFHSAGLALTGLALGHDAAPLLPGWALLGLLVVFLAAWVWQQARLSAGKGLPLPLYVHLINAGALPAAITGDDQ
jgi:NADH:ubiquinone oxidoreductase subunit 5 (subunit L)/multisubunit Na+/H+ antiporter MnhA subunit